MSYTPGFMRSWSAYTEGMTPKWKGRNRKREAFRVWEKLRLEMWSDSVVEWAGTVDRSEGGRWAQGFQVWLKAHDFSDAPPRDALHQPASPPANVSDREQSIRDAMERIAKREARWIPAPRLRRMAKKEMS